MNKKKAIVVLVIALLFLEVGCMDTNENYKSQGDDAIKYISEKYDRDFYPLSYDLADYLSDDDMVECYTDGMDPENEHVTIVISKEYGSISYHDNYFGFLIRDDMENYIGEFVEKEFTDYKTYVNINSDSFPDGLNVWSDLYDLYDTFNDYWMTATVFVKGNANISEEEYSERTNRIIQSLKESYHRYTFNLFVLDETYYNGMDRYSQDAFWDDYLKPGDKTAICVFESRSTIIDGEVG